MTYPRPQTSDRGWVCREAATKTYSQQRRKFLQMLRRRHLTFLGVHVQSEQSLNLSAARGSQKRCHPSRSPRCRTGDSRSHRHTSRSRPCSPTPEWQRDLLAQLIRCLCEDVHFIDVVIPALTLSVSDKRHSQIRSEFQFKREHFLESTSSRRVFFCKNCGEGSC